MMRTEAEVEQAVRILAASFIGPMRPFVWGTLNEERGRAWAMFQVLGWVAGADDSEFNLVLEYVASKIQVYIETELEKDHARNGTHTQ